MPVNTLSEIFLNVLILNCSNLSEDVFIRAVRLFFSSFLPPAERFDTPDRAGYNTVRKTVTIMNTHRRNQNVSGRCKTL